MFGLCMTCCLGHLLCSTSLLHPFSSYCSLSYTSHCLCFHCGVSQWCGGFFCAKHRVEALVSSASGEPCSITPGARSCTGAPAFSLGCQRSADDAVLCLSAVQFGSSNQQALGPFWGRMGQRAWGGLCSWQLLLRGNCSAGIIPAGKRFLRYPSSRSTPPTLELLHRNLCPGLF